MRIVRLLTVFLLACWGATLSCAQMTECGPDESGQVTIRGGYFTEYQLDINQAHSDWSPLAYIKTNLPAWGIAWVNIALEADLAEHWSFALPVYWSGWDYFSSTHKYRTFAVQPELRYWPKRSNRGFFAGAHFGLAYYNCAFGGKYRYQDHNGDTPALGGGICVGWRTDFGHRRAWCIEASVGGGVYRLDYDLFYNRPNGLECGRRQRTLWCIDNVALSIGWHFGLFRDKKAVKGGRQ